MQRLLRILRRLSACISDGWAGSAHPISDKPPDDLSTVQQIVFLLELLADTEVPSEDELVQIAAWLLTIGTRSQWRDAMFMADIDGEDPPDDRYAFYSEAGRQLSVPELVHILESFRLRRSFDPGDRIRVAGALLAFGTSREWHAALLLTTEL